VHSTLTDDIDCVEFDVGFVEEGRFFISRGFFCLLLCLFLSEKKIYAVITTACMSYTISGSLDGNAFCRRKTRTQNSNPQLHTVTDDFPLFFPHRARTMVLWQGCQGRCKGPMNILKHPPRHPHPHQDTVAQPGYQQCLTMAGTQRPQAPRVERTEREGHSPCPGEQVAPAASPSPQHRVVAGLWG